MLAGVRADQSAGVVEACSAYNAQVQLQASQTKASEASKPKIACQLQRPLGGVREKPTDEFCEAIGHGLGRQARGIDDFKAERIGLFSKMRGPRGHLVCCELRLGAAMVQAVVTLAAFAIEKNRMDTAVHTSGCGRNERGSSLSV
jgi:hypothetical protein